MENIELLKRLAPSANFNHHMLDSTVSTLLNPRFGISCAQRPGAIDELFLRSCLAESDARHLTQYFASTLHREPHETARGAAIAAYFIAARDRYTQDWSPEDLDRDSILEAQESVALSACALNKRLVQRIVAAATSKDPPELGRPVDSNGRRVVHDEDAIVRDAWVVGVLCRFGLGRVPANSPNRASETRTRMKQMADFVGKNPGGLEEARELIAALKNEIESRAEADLDYRQPKLTRKRRAPAADQETAKQIHGALARAGVHRPLPSIVPASKWKM